MWANLKGRPLEIQSTSGDEDTTTRVLFTLDALSDGTLQRLYDLWRCRADASRLAVPTLGDMADHPGLTADCHLIDVAQPNPWHFQILEYGARSAASRGSNYAGLHLGEIPSRLHSAGLQVDYNTAKMLGVPRLQAITTRYDHRSRSYARLILPVSLDGRAIDRLMIGVSIVTEEDHYSSLSETGIDGLRLRA